MHLTAAPPTSSWHVVQLRTGTTLPSLIHQVLVRCFRPSEAQGNVINCRFQPGFANLSAKIGRWSYDMHVFVSPNNVLNNLTDFHETWYEQHYVSHLFIFLEFLLIIIIVFSQICGVHVILMSLLA